MKKQSFPVFELLQAIVCAALSVGLLTGLGPCGPKADGGWMSCHWAGQAVTGVSALLLIFALVRLFAKDKGIRVGMDIASIPTALLAALLPGTLVSLCMMADMQCRSAMRPSVLVFSILIMVLSAADLARNLKKK